MEERERQKITVFLAEYSTLRTEVLTARDNVSKASSVFAAALMADIAFGFSFGKERLIVAIVVSTIIGLIALGYLLWMIWWNEKNTRNFTRRIREIEKEICSLMGRPVLIWETVHGWGGMFTKTNPNFQGFNAPERSWWPPTPPQSK